MSKRTYDITGGLEPLERLAVAIIRQAVDDWRETKYQMQQVKRGCSEWERLRCSLYSIEGFFVSDWGGMLTYDQGKRLLRQLKKGESFAWQQNKS